MSNLQLNGLEMRLKQMGGFTSLDRMIKQKQQSLKSALQDSYQSEVILTLPQEEEFQCLINPDSLAQDYDTKIISIPFEAGFREGSTFLWTETNTYWIVLLQELTEKAFFKGFIKRCEKSININDQEYWFYVKGPSNTSARWQNVSGAFRNVSGTFISGYDSKIEILIENNQDTKKAFAKFNTVTIDGNNWQVEAVDSVSSDYILEVSLKEAANNPLKELESQAIITEVNTAQPHIAGLSILRPYQVATYLANTEENAAWTISNKKAKIIVNNGKSVTIEVVSGKSGTFNLEYGTLVLPITIESL